VILDALGNFSSTVLT